MKNTYKKRILGTSYSVLSPNISSSNSSTNFDEMCYWRFTTNHHFCGLHKNCNARFNKCAKLILKYYYIQLIFDEMNSFVSKFIFLASEIFIYNCFILIIRL